MTSREHARRLMLILLSSHGRPDAEAGRPGESGDSDDERQDRDDQDDSTESEDRRTSALVEALMWS